MIDTLDRASGGDQPGWRKTSRLLQIGALLALALDGALFGFAIGAFAHKGITVRGIGALVGGTILLAVIFASNLRRGFSRRATLTAYDRRGLRWFARWLVAALVLGALSGFVAPASFAALFGIGSIQPVVAIVAALSLAVAFASMQLGCHRLIDELDESALLWANTLAYYFVVIAIPAWWLLGRAKIVMELGPFAILVILVASFTINGVAWAWIKYR